MAGDSESFVEKYISPRCESPIEKMFLVAWARRLDQDHADGVADFSLGGYERFELLPAVTRLTALHVMGKNFVCLQQPIDAFRVDFVLCRVAYDIDFSSEPPVEVLRKLPPVVVECDGHDFHERTKEQAQRDKSRDRKLTAMGFRVIRFTGSEIFRDADRCAAEVDALFECLLHPRIVESASPAPADEQPSE